MIVRLVFDEGIVGLVCMRVLLGCLLAMVVVLCCLLVLLVVLVA